MQGANARKQSTRWVTGLIYVGFLLVLFSFGKGVIDLLTAPKNTINLAADDEISSGFLPVYVEQNGLADSQLVAVDFEKANEADGESFADPQAFPTQEAQGSSVEIARDPGLQPDKILMPSIGLDASIIPVDFVEYKFEGKTYQQWLAPEYRAVGWHSTSAGLGVPGNTVLNGHHNIHGEVFRDLYRVQVGERINLYSNGQEFSYVVVYTDILPERNQPLEVRLANAEWIEATEDERITLITCWPYESNTHRVVVVAVPVRTDESSG